MAFRLRAKNKKDFYQSVEENSKYIAEGIFHLWVKPDYPFNIRIRGHKIANNYQFNTTLPT